jgi:hypothetical protein
MGALTPGTTDHVINPVDLHDGTAPRIESPSPGSTGFDNASGGGAGPAQRGLSEHVVGFARRKKGTHVGDGQCFALADQALRAAGAKTAKDFGEITRDTDYVWGKPVNEADVQPGDIVQFRDYKFRVEDTATDGSSEWHEGERPHHTAVVERVEGGGALWVLEQNVPKRERVRRDQLFFKSGSFPHGGKSRSVDVKGSFWFYRPQAQ